MNTKQILTAFFILIFSNSYAKEYSVTLKVDMRNVSKVTTVGVKGSISPLSWERTTELVDTDNDGIFEKTIHFSSDKSSLRIKFTSNGQEELKGFDSRKIWLKDSIQTAEFVFNEYNYFSEEAKQQLNYTEEQLLEDVRILRTILPYVHPRAYQFIDSLELGKGLDTLTTNLLKNKTLENAYGEFSKFSAKIKCSHTFTNPYNQWSKVEGAIFNQPNNLPFTFKRIGKRMFVDKDASLENKLTKGFEIITINGVPTDVIFSKLSNYVSSDGSNEEKKLERLVISGTEKYAMFDIFYPIEFGEPKDFKLELQNPTTGESNFVTVETTSKTNRSSVLEKRYQMANFSVEDSWNFELIDEQSAKLTLGTFAVYDKGFDWKQFLGQSFETLQKNQIENLIIDIRGNEGGETEISEYLIKNILSETYKIPALQSSVNYLTIPENFKKYIHTWDKFPYNFTNKYSEIQEGKYVLKGKYSVESKQYSPTKNGFRGKVFLITDASNSSATHLLSMYAKDLSNVTIVGQPTGGNQLGTNGGYIFFLRLPNTKIDIDIPVISQRVQVKDPIDGGVVPDVLVKKEVTSFLSGEDQEMKTILKLIELEK